MYGSTANIKRIISSRCAPIGGHSERFVSIVAIFPQLASLILKEHKYQAIDGDLLLIGRQSVMLTRDQAGQLIEAEGIAIHPDAFEEIDEGTVGSRGDGYLTDRSFFSLFCGARVRAIDVSNYEGAEIVHDLNCPVGPEHHGIADVIFDGSCLDNLFDPATALKSISTMLRPHGRAICFEHGTPIQSAMLCFSPEWFFDFFACNDYDDCQVFVCSFGQSMQNPWVVRHWRPFFEDRGTLERSPISFGYDYVTVVVAQKGESSTNDRTPIQGHYRQMHDGGRDAYVDRHVRYQASGRSYQFVRAYEPIAPDAERLARDAERIRKAARVIGMLEPT